MLGLRVALTPTKVRGDVLVILLTGGTKKRQQRDIDEAHAYWRDYKQSRRGRR